MYKNNLVLLIISITLVLLGLLIFVPLLANFFGFAPMNIVQFGICTAIGFISVIWFEVVKWWKRR
jgi:Ca2+-transporting ATPase